MNWNEDFISSIKFAIDRVLGSFIDQSRQSLKVEISQTIKEHLHQLDESLKSEWISKTPVKDYDL
jgi:hypothetical protein